MFLRTFFINIFFTIILVLSFFSSSCDNSKTEEQSKTISTPMKIEKVQNLYKEQHRPQFHFSPKEKWMNDPNGMVYYEGEYHLFYQYYPDSTVWGPMHWGHAVSKDLVRWEHLPIALYPDELGYIFSGSAVVDWKNTSGLGKDGQPPMVAIFTHHDPQGEKAETNEYQYQSIAYSNDKGRTWTKYKGNPVIPNTQKIKDFRDPKVIWDEKREQWIMVFAAADHVKLWSSKDLKNWIFLSDFGKNFGSHGGVWECPDLFPMKINGTEESKWVMLLSINPGGPNGGSATQYFVGDFDGTKFTLDQNFKREVTKEQAVWLDYGRDNYAGVTWSDVPQDDGRRIFIGWMSNWNYAQVVPTERWRSAMTIPRTLSLEKFGKSYRVYSLPVMEIDRLRSNSSATIDLDFKGRHNLRANASQSKLIVDFDLDKTDANNFGIELSNGRQEVYRFGFDKAKNRYYSDRTKAGNHSFSDKFGSDIHYASREANSNTISLQIFIDASSIEIFADNGATVMTDIFFPSEPFSALNLFTEEDKVAYMSVGKIYTLRGIWE